MMGVGYTGGYQPIDQRKIKEKFAWLPVRSTRKKWIWFDTYYQIHTYYDENGKPPIKDLYWLQVLTNHEYLLWEIKNPKRESLIPR